MAAPQGPVAAPKKSWADVTAQKAPEEAPAQVKAPEPGAVQAPVGGPAPVVNRQEQKLRNIFRDLDKGKKKPADQRFGSGSTADAVRHELKNPGVKVGGRSHSTKAEEYSKALDNWIARNPGASPALVKEAQERSKDLKDALDGK